MLATTRKTALRNIFSGIFFIALFFFGAGAADAQCACSSGSESVDAAFDWADAVFAGEVVEVKKVSAGEESEFEVTFKVKKRWKDASAENITVRNKGADDADFAAGESYLVYARIYENKLRAYIGCCTRTRKLAAAKEDLKALAQRAGKVKGNK